MDTKKDQAREDLSANLERTWIDCQGLSDRELATAAFKLAVRKSTPASEGPMSDESIMDVVATEIAQMRKERWGSAAN